MALTINNYTDASGNTAPSSYWRATTIKIDALDGSIVVIFVGWKDQASHDAGLAPLSGAKKVYSLSGAAFAGVAAATPTGNTLYDVLANAAEGYALATKDEKDAQGNPVSFFEAAQ